MEQKDIDRLLACRKAIDDHRVRKADARVSTSQTVPMQNVFEASRDIYLKVLGDNGFKTLDDFMKFNEAMCLLTLKEYIPVISGKCDLCLQESEPLCKLSGFVPKDYIGGLCFYNPKSVTPQEWYPSVLDMFRQGHKLQLGADGKHRMFCPDGHGWTVEPTSKDFAIDILWK